MIAAGGVCDNRVGLWTRIDSEVSDATAIWCPAPAKRPSGGVGQGVWFAVFARQIGVGLLIPHEPLLVRIEGQLAAGP